MRHLLRFFPWLVAVLLVGWVAQTVPLAALGQVLGRLDGVEVVVLVGMNGAVLLALNGRWWYILRGYGCEVPFLTLMSYRLVAFGISYFTPGPHFGGEPAQVYLVERFHATPRPVAVAAVALDKSLELLINFAFLVIGVLVMAQGQIFGGVVGWETAVFAVLLLCVPTGFLLATGSGYQPLSGLWQAGSFAMQPGFHGRWQARLQRVEGQIAHFCRTSPYYFGAAVGMSLLGWAAMIAEFWLMSAFLGVQLSGVQLLVVLTAARAAILLPSPGALGTLEASQVWAFGGMGLETAVALSLSLLIRARDVMIGGMGLWLGSRWLGK